MIKHALFVRLEAKPGKEQAVADFLAAGAAMANQEATTPIWFALQLSPTTFGIFDAFANEADRQAHLNGDIAKALMANASALLATPPSIEPIDVLAMKNKLV
jgi:quinol monooxygenase YgiN